MTLRTPTIVLILLVQHLVTFVASAQTSGTAQIQAVFKKANHYFNLVQPTDETDLRALELFQQVIDKLEKEPAQLDSKTLFHAYLNKAILLELKPDYTASRHEYLKAVALSNSSRGIGDSLCFQLYTHLGSAYYRLNHFDSAKHFLLRAEKLLPASNSANDRARLYNTFGVLYFDNGNYRQSKRYFINALDVFVTQHKEDDLSAINIQTNIATADFKLGNLHSSLERNQSILKYKTGTDYICMSIGKTQAALNRLHEAMASFRKVSPHKVPGVYNEMAVAQLGLKQNDSAEYFLEKFRKLSTEGNRIINRLDVGVNHLYAAYLLREKGELFESLKSVQNAIISFSSNFQFSDIYENPPGFAGSFAYFRLFEALKTKAALFHRLYKKTQELRYLDASLNTYLVTLEFLSYIEKNYEGDDAKLLLKKNTRDVHEEALEVSMQLQKIKPGDKYQQLAFSIAELNKGSVVASNVLQLAVSQEHYESNAIGQKIRNLRFAIARLNVRIDNSEARDGVTHLLNERNDYEMELSRASKMLGENDSYYRSKHETQRPSVADLQKKLLPQQALISYYISRGLLYRFIITTNSFTSLPQVSWSSIKDDLNVWVSALRNTENGRKFIYGEEGERLYRGLVRDVYKTIPRITEWIIIPDGPLAELPFESLPVNSQMDVLLQSVAVSYEFSCQAFIQRPTLLKAADYSVLSFAPFTGRNKSASSTSFGTLPSSLSEVADLPGKRYFDDSATVQRFLKELNDFPVVHLATHAYADAGNPAASFIAFAQAGDDSLESRLFLEQLYGLKMDSTSLLMLGACETGEGELASGEGVLSLSRGFAYAGCAATISSLWKADDKATAFILSRFHKLMAKGLSKSVALQQAKLSYIREHDIAITPNYWANLVLIGDPAALVDKKGDYFWSYLISSIYLMFLFCAVLYALKR